MSTTLPVKSRRQTFAARREERTLEYFIDDKEPVTRETRKMIGVSERTRDRLYEISRREGMTLGQTVVALIAFYDQCR